MRTDIFSTHRVLVGGEAISQALWNIVGASRKLLFIIYMVRRNARSMLPLR